MAETMQIDGGEATAKLRSPIAVGLLTVMTLNLYSLVWWFLINRELAALAKARGLERVANRPWLALLAVSAPYIATLLGGGLLALTEYVVADDDSAWLEGAFAVLFVGLAVAAVALVVTTVRTFQRVKHAQASVGVTRDRLANGFIFAIGFVVFTPVAYGYLQQELNKMWRRSTGEVGSSPTQPLFVQPVAPET